MPIGASGALADADISQPFKKLSFNYIHRGLTQVQCQWGLKPDLPRDCSVFKIPDPTQDFGV